MIGKHNNSSFALVKSSIIFGVGYAIPAAFTFLLFTVSALYLSPEELGIIGVAEAVAIVVAHLSLLSLPAALRRLYYLPEFKYSRNGLISSIVIGGMLVAILAGLLCLLIGPFVVDLLPSNLPDFFPYFACAILYQLMYQALEYRLTIYQVEQKPGAFAVVQVVSGFTVFAITFLAIGVLNGGAGEFLVGRFLGIFGVFLVVIYGMRRLLQFGWNGDVFKVALRYSLPLIPHVIAMISLNFMDRIMLQIFSTATEVGLYTLAYNLGLAMYLVTVAFNMAWGPFFFEAVEGGDRKLREVSDLSGKAIAIAISIAIVGVVISKDFVTRFFSEEYHAIVTIVPLVITGYLLFFYYSIFSHSMLYKNEPMKVGRLSIIAALINCILNALLIPGYGMFGAAWATIFSFGLMAVVSYFHAVQVTEVRYPAKIMSIAFVLFLCVLVVSSLGSLDRVVVYAFGAVAIVVIVNLSIWRKSFVQ